MRIWDLSPEDLCRQHLLGEHRELHAIWVIITQSKPGYAHHPEVARWRGRLRALYIRHQCLVKEFHRRGYEHHSPLPQNMATGLAGQDTLIDSIDRQRDLLRAKGCDCRVEI